MHKIFRLKIYSDIYRGTPVCLFINTGVYMKSMENSLLKSAVQPMKKKYARAQLTVLGNLRSLTLSGTASMKEGTAVGNWLRKPGG